MKYGILTLLLVAGALNFATAEVAQAENPKPEASAFHGFAVFGAQSIFASHLPMFHAPHDYQVVVEVKLENLGPQKVREIYLQRQKSDPTLFTLAPKKFALGQMVEGKVQTLTGELYLGHFEQGGKLLGPIEVQIQKILLAKKLDPQAKETGQYQFIGTSGEYFGIHLIGGRPNFDWIAQVSHPFERVPGKCPSRLCGSFMFAEIADSRLPMITKHVSEDSAQIVPKEGAIVGNTLSPEGVGAQVLKVIHFNTEDLAL